MWHVGIHIWEVNPNEIEPDYDEYYGVCRHVSPVATKLTSLGCHGIQPFEHTDIAARQSIDYSTTIKSWSCH